MMCGMLKSTMKDNKFNFPQNKYVVSITTSDEAG